MLHPIALMFAVVALAAAEPLRVCATVSDLGDLARAVGGPAIEVTVFARGGDDPHFVEPRPGFAKALARADLVASIGLELEIGWLPVVLGQARNPRLARGQPGWFEAAGAVALLGVPQGPVDRSRGDVHAGGNPHFLIDPVRGVQVARALAGRFGELRPELAAPSLARWRAFALEVGRRLLGPALVERVGEAAVVEALAGDGVARLAAEASDLGGWLGALRPFAGARLVADHDLWPYLSERFALPVAGFLEPMPGVAPTTAHLATVVDLVRTSQVRAVITAPYFDPRHAAFVSQAARVPVIPLAHQSGATEDAPDWLAMIDRNVRALAAGLKGGR
jgi:zinc/manganese transport system substrate-binding protein